MAVPGSGAISLNDFHIEAGGTSGTQAAINDQDIRDLIGKASGVQMAFSEWYGATAGPNFAAIPAPTRSTAVVLYGGAAYLKDEGDGNGDVMFAGGILQAGSYNEMKWSKFGTNNKLSTWSASSAPVSTAMPNPRYATGNRAMSPALMGGRKFVVATENWLGYTTGMAVAMYTFNGATADPVLTTSWTQLFGNQTETAAVLMDPVNEGNGAVINKFTYTQPNQSSTWAYPFRVSGTSITAQTAQGLSSNQTGGFKSGQYYGGRLVTRTNSADGRQNYVNCATMNTSTGAFTSVGGIQLPGGTQQYGWSMDGVTQEIFCLNGTWLIVWRDDSTYNGSSDQGHLKISRMTFSGNTITFNNTVTTGLGIGSTYRLSYKIGEAASTSSDSIYVANYSSSDGTQTTPTQQVWQWNGSAIVKTYEDTGTGLLNSVVGFTLNNSAAPSPALYYTANDDVLGQMSAGSKQQLMPWYWSHK